MAELVANILGILGNVQQLAPAVWDRFMCLYKYKANIDNLVKEVEKLKKEKEEVDDATWNGRSTTESINIWRNEVDIIIHTAEESIIRKATNLRRNVTRDEKHEHVNPDEAEKENNPCFMRFRPNLITRYKLSKEASVKVKTIGELLKEVRKFPNVSDETTLQQIWLKPASGYNTFKSRESTLEDILNALNRANCHMIGIYGMGGVGKTTLAKEVGRIAMKDKTFDKVALVEVTATPDIKAIQREIAEQLHLTLPDGSESKRANKLYEVLKNNKKSDEENGRSPVANEFGLKNDKKNDTESNKKKDEKDEKNKKILIILDNIWDELKVEKIGIPSGVDFGESKLLLTTRDRNVLERMGCELFQIGKLDEKEAWALFKETAGNFIEQDDLKPLTQEVCKKCGGLPIAIVAVAKALSNRRNPSEWTEALEQFKRPSPDNFEDDLEPAYLSIELSYKSLRGKQLKKTFLLCSLMGHEGSILDLLKYVMGLNIFEDIYTMQKARDRVCKFIHRLKDSSLLLDGQTSESFSMHDFVREVAISIAKRDEHVFSVRNDTDPWEWPHNDRLKICTKIFIRDSAIFELPEGLECPQLESFFMNTNFSDSHLQISSMPASRLKNTNLGDSLIKIPQKFFMGMTKLKVLDLTKMQLFCLPSLLLLKDLQTLCLDSCNYEDVAIIGELKCLKILSLRGSNVKNLPQEIAQLTKLRLLDLSYCEQLKVIAPNVISSLFRLEELYMCGCSIEWQTEVPDVKQSNADLKELKQLSQLTTLELDIEDDKILPQHLFSKELKRYNISIGVGSSAFGGSHIYGDRSQSMVITSFSFEEQSTFRTLRTLKLKCNSTICSDELQGFNNVEFLCLDELEGVQNVLYELNNKGFSQLKHLHVHNNHNLLCIVDARRTYVFPAFPLLESMILFNLINLKNICFGQPKERSFQNLKRLIINGCEKLEYMFSSSMVESFKQLQHLEICNCKVLKTIVVKEEVDQATTTFEFPKVASLKLEDLPKLITFFLGTRPLKWPMLKELEVSKCDKLQIFTSQYEVGSPNLKALVLVGVNSENFPFQRLSNLEKLKCDEVSYTEIFFCGEDEKHSVKPTQIKHLELNHLFGLKYIWKRDSKLDSVLKNLEVLKVFGCFKLTNLAPTSASFRNLKALEVHGCHRLINLMTSSIAKSLVQLREMEIEQCNIMIEIVASEKDAAEDEICFSELKFLSLQDLEGLTCFSSRNCIFNFPSLEELIVAKCPNMKTFSSGKLITPKLLKVKQKRGDEDEGCWEDELNGTIQQLHRKLINTNAEEYTLSGKDITPVWEGQFPENFCELKGLKIIEDESENIPIGIFQRLNNLEKLKLKVSAYKEIFSRGKDEKYAGMLPQIKVLHLQGLFNLKYMWEGDSQLDSIIQNLEILNVHYCPNLITLVPPSAYFENLTTLEICCCDGLINLLSYSTAKSLVRLEEMRVGTCEMMTAIVGNKGEVAEDEIIFSKLTLLTLASLESLTCFHPGNYSFKFPSLDEIIVYKCPKLEIFSRGELSAPKLEEVRHFRTSHDDEDCWEGDLNTTIQHLHKKVNIQSSEKQLDQTSMELQE